MKVVQDDKKKKKVAKKIEKKRDRERVVCSKKIGFGVKRTIPACCFSSHGYFISFKILMIKKDGIIIGDDLSICIEPVYWKLDCISS